MKQHLNLDAFDAVFDAPPPFGLAAPTALRATSLKLVTEGPILGSHTGYTSVTRGSFSEPIHLTHPLSVRCPPQFGTSAILQPIRRTVRLYGPKRKQQYGFIKGKSGSRFCMRDRNLP